MAGQFNSCGHDLLDELLKHLFPLRWGHVNLTGDYIWAAAGEANGGGEREVGLAWLAPTSP